MRAAHLGDVSIPGTPESPANASIRGIQHIPGHLPIECSLDLPDADLQKDNLN